MHHAARRAGGAHRRPPPAPAPAWHQAADRVRSGAAFPSTFTEADAPGYDWLTWRRGPLPATPLLPIPQTITLRGDREREVAWTDEQITMKDSATGPATDPVRDGKMAAQAAAGFRRRRPS